MRVHSTTALALRALALGALLAAAPAAAALPPLQVGPAVRVGSGAAPQVAVFADGAFVVVWSGRSTSGAATLHARLFDRAGAPKGGEVELLRPAGQVLDGVAALPNGFVAVWDQANGHGLVSVLARVWNRRGAPLTAPFKVHADSSYERCCAQVAAGPGSGFTVAWSSAIGGPRDRGYTSIVDSRSFDATGRPLGPEPVDPPVDNQTPFPFELDQNYPLGLTVDADGRAVSVNLDVADEWTIDYVRGGSTVRLMPTEPFFGQYEVTASMQPGGGPTLAWATGEPGYTFPASLGSSILVRRFAADGTPLGSAPLQANRRQGWEESPRLATFPDGSTFVLWAEITGFAANDTSVLFARSFDASGAPTSRERPIGANAERRQVAATLAARPQGDAIAAWVEESAGISTVYARLLAAPAR